MREIKLHRSFRHENIVRFDHFFEDKIAVYMLLELCDSGSLNDLIKRRKTLDEIEVRYYAQ